MVAQRGMLALVSALCVLRPHASMADSPGDMASLEQLDHIAAAARQAGFSCEGKEAVFIGTSSGGRSKADFWVLTCKDDHRFGYLDFGEGIFQIEHCEVMEAHGLTCF